MNENFSFVIFCKIFLAFRFKNLRKRRNNKDGNMATGVDFISFSLSHNKYHVSQFLNCRLKATK